jgi:hypothetical protein
MMIKQLGSFEVVSGEILISDPCYDIPTWCTALVKAKNGIWDAWVHISDTGDWGMRVAQLFARHEDLEGHVSADDEIGEAGVDSGQCGFFDIEHFKDDSLVDESMRTRDDWLVEEELWYSLCCDVTLSSHAGVIPFGVVSRSGYGDGGYDVSGHKNGDDEYDMLVLRFI